MYYPGLEGKNVLLIGGHSNIGQHVTKLFAKGGANITIGARDVKRAEQVAAEARQLNRSRINVVHVDATNRQSVDSLVARALQTGPLDVVYHGIGWIAFGGFLELDSTAWDSLYERNFKCVLLAYKAVLPIMKRQRTGCFITMSSAHARLPSPMDPVYCALKGALIHVAQALALEVASFGVRINVVAPGPTPPSEPSSISANSVFSGFMDTPIFAAMSKTFAEQTPLRELADPESVAHAVLYLASPVTGRFQTGQVLGVDGGLCMPK